MYLKNIVDCNAKSYRLNLMLLTHLGNVVALRLPVGVEPVEGEAGNGAPGTVVLVGGTPRRRHVHRAPPRYLALATEIKLNELTKVISILN